MLKLLTAQKKSLLEEEMEILVQWSFADLG